MQFSESAGSCAPASATARFRGHCAEWLRARYRAALPLALCKGPFPLWRFVPLRPFWLDLLCRLLVIVSLGGVPAVAHATVRFDGRDACVSSPPRRRSVVAAGRGSARSRTIVSALCRLLCHGCSWARREFIRCSSQCLVYSTVRRTLRQLSGPPQGSAVSPRGANGAAPHSMARLSAARGLSSRLCPVSRSVGQRIIAQATVWFRGRGADGSGSCCAAPKAQGVLFRVRVFCSVRLLVRAVRRPFFGLP